MGIIPKAGHVALTVPEGQADSDLSQQHVACHAMGKHVWSISAAKRMATN